MLENKTSIKNENHILFLLIVVTTFPVKAQQATNLPSDSQPVTPVVYVVGDVPKPAKIPYQESISLLKAIRLAGGTVISEKNSRAIISRTTPNCKFYTPISIDLRDILSNKAAATILEANDIVEVIKRKGKYKTTLKPCSAPAESRPTIIRPYL